MEEKVKEGVEEVLEKIDKAIEEVKKEEREVEFIVTKVIHEGEEGVRLGKFTVRERRVKKGEEKIGYKSSFSVLKTPSFYEDIKEGVRSWIKEYKKREELKKKLSKLNKDIEEIIEEEGIRYKIEFVYGDLLEYSTDTYVKIGLKESVINNIESLPLYDRVEVRARSYREEVKDVLKTLDKPYELVKTKSVFTKDLGIYTRKSLYKLIRGFTRRQIGRVRLGEGYVQKGEIFGVIEKVGLKEKEEGYEYIEEIKEEREKEKGIKYIGYRYTISPINKELGYAEEMSIEEALEE